MYFLPLQSMQLNNYRVDRAAMKASLDPVCQDLPLDLAERLNGATATVEAVEEVQRHKGANRPRPGRHATGVPTHPIYSPEGIPSIT